MIYSRLLLVSCALVFVLAVLHITAIQFYLYWVFWWFDILTHFIGGLFVATMSLWLYFNSGLIKTPRRRKGTVFFVALLSVVIAGTAWELFEFFAGTPEVDSYLLDTFIDALMNATGAIVGAHFIIRLRLVKLTMEYVTK